VVNQSFKATNGIAIFTTSRGKWNHAVCLYKVCDLRAGTSRFLDLIGFQWISSCVVVLFPVFSILFRQCYTDIPFSTPYNAVLLLSTFQPLTKLHTTYPFFNFLKVKLSFNIVIMVRFSSGCTVFVFTVLAIGVWLLPITFFAISNLSSFTFVGLGWEWVRSSYRYMMVGPVVVVIEMINLTMFGIPSLVHTKHSVFPQIWQPGVAWGVEGEGVGECRQRLERCTAGAQISAKENACQFYIDKPEVMWLTRRRNNKEPKMQASVQVETQEVWYKKEVTRCLGVWLDNILMLHD